MDLPTLRCFVVTAEEEHIGRAALRLHLSPSPLSRQIRKLEAELGLILFERIHQRIRLTEAGRQFLADARGLLSHAEAIREKSRKRAAGAGGSLSLGAVPGAMMDGRVPEALRNLRALCPGVTIRVVPGRSAALVDELRRGKVDVAFVHGLPDDMDALESRLCSRGPFKVAMPADHPLAQEQILTPASLDGEPWVTLDGTVSPSFRPRLLQACREAGFSPDIRFETSDIASQLGLVQAGLCCGLVQASLARWGIPNGVVLRDLAAFPLVVEIHALWRSSNPAPEPRRFLDLL